ncbi:MAG: PhoU domain-containing protein [Candidatus Krumholzibacteria bacterium]|nr:PhoU domain-containing protein [Candidatus Krumholzibacteria bacterium]
MGFGSILDVFKADNWSNELVDMIVTMLEKSHDMYDFTIGVLINGDPNEDPQGRVYAQDQKINQLERKIRRRVVSRLSVSGSRADVPSALIFMNAVKDAERLGDYVKNLHEVGDMMPEGVDRKLYKDKLGTISSDISAMFDDTRKAFAESDEEMAGKVIKHAKRSGREFEALIREITVSDLDVNNAVCLVLIRRFYKRLVAHMSNIASTVVMPVDMIDYYDESET